MNEKFNENLRKARIEKKLTQQLSERFGIPKRTIEDWSRGVRKCPEYVVNMMMELLERDKIEK